MFCDVLRFYITNHEEMNPGKIDFTDKNLTLFRVYVPEQTDDILCGYNLLRKMIEIILCEEHIFSITVKDLIGGDVTYEEYKAYIKNAKLTDNHLNDKITIKSNAVFSRSLPKMSLDRKLEFYLVASSQFIRNSRINQRKFIPWGETSEK